MRLTLLGGFLGSGKTTWLRHQLHEGTLADAFVIVNEAAETPVDDALLASAREIAVLAGGCVCCQARGDLIALLRRICDERSRHESASGRLERLVIETSGLADPGPIVEAIRTDPVLVHHIVVTEIVVAVDALHGLTQLRSEPLGRRQAEIADRLVITKTDEIDDENDLARLIATLRRLNPGASVSGAVLGTEVPLPSDDGVEAENLPAIDGEATSAPIFPARLALGPEIDWAAFNVWLSALLHARGDDVLRVKGVVRTPAGRLLLQTVRRIVQSPEILPEQGEEGGREDDMIVIIGRGYQADDLKRSLARFAGVQPGAMESGR